MNYQTASSVATARLGADDKFLAGGQSLLGAIKLGLAAPSGLVDVRHLPELQGIIIVGGGALRIGAATTHATVAASADVQRAIPALADLAGRIGDRQVRNAGTLGGSLANNDPAACYPAATLALGATVHTQRRTIAADDFFQGLFTTALEEGELITAVSFPVPKAAAWQKFKQPASRFSLVGVFVARFDTGVRVAITGAGPGVFRCAELETALDRDWSPAAARAVKVGADGLNTDLHGTAEYRAALIPELAARAVASV
ncbi:carbon-monoxide dehydrogenase medium subunit [Roseateles saccharophilus]|uniref:Carbon-monoxide dehydrogenase medium subunit n=3 Tax=Roseateles saccharophilus TaxID=304 RepID=A0A4R3VJE5_ROSSA|nr:carbon-monoxide dehydrogenase medium subunit [Roseateles saccharophilus]